MGLNFWQLLPIHRQDVIGYSNMLKVVAGTAVPEFTLIEPRTHEARCLAMRNAHRALLSRKLENGLYIGEAVALVTERAKEQLYPSDEPDEVWALLNGLGVHTNLKNDQDVYGVAEIHSHFFIYDDYPELREHEQMLRMFPTIFNT